MRNEVEVASGSSEGGHGLGGAVVELSEVEFSEVARVLMSCEVQDTGGNGVGEGPDGDGGEVAADAKYSTAARALS
jgi:hypothetical protein